MDRKTIHEKIAELTELININNNRLFLHDDKIAQLEIDVLRKNAIELYEQINQLHIANLKQKEEPRLTAAINDAIAVNEVAKEPAINEKPAEPEVEIIEVNESLLPEPEIVEETLPEPTTEPEQEPVVEIEPVEPEIMMPPADDKKPEISRNLFDEPTTLKTEPANPAKPKESDHLFEKYRKTKIDSIQKAISILKKYEYQNTLFANDNNTYKEAIEMLDKAANGQVALSLLENTWPQKYQWDESTESLVEELKELVYRRHS